ncbi:MAG: NADH-quinone oxidoreductase subunit NuoK [Myxococcales bacterium]|nr:NADH-quinone oxidoreductase subunit NuoK [Myxococcales bacterium]
MPVQPWLLLGAALFALGVYGVLTRRNAIGVLVAIELMANAVNLNLAVFSRLHGNLHGQAFALFGLALTVAEVAVGLSIVILLHRSHRSVRVGAASELKG